MMMMMMMGEKTCTPLSSGHSSRSKSYIYKCSDGIARSPRSLYLIIPSLPKADIIIRLNQPLFSPASYLFFFKPSFLPYIALHYITLPYTRSSQFDTGNVPRSFLVLVLVQGRYGVDGIWRRWEGRGVGGRLLCTMLYLWMGYRELKIQLTSRTRQFAEVDDDDDDGGRVQSIGISFRPVLMREGRKEGGGWGSELRC